MSRTHTQSEQANAANLTLCPLLSRPHMFNQLMPNRAPPERVTVRTSTITTQNQHQQGVKIAKMPKKVTIGRQWLWGKSQLVNSVAMQLSFCHNLPAVE